MPLATWLPPGSAGKEINLRTSIETAMPTESALYSFGDMAARHVLNNGIERSAGVAPLYMTKTALAAGNPVSAAYAKSGAPIQVDTADNVWLNGKVVGNVGPYAVTPRGSLPGYSDAAWTPQNTIVGIFKVGSAIQVDEYSPATGKVINTRQTMFAMPQIAITTVALVKYVGLKYADSLSFLLSNSQISYVLAESGTAVNTVGGGLTWTARTLEANNWYSVCWSPQLSLFMAVGGGATHYGATSPDGVNWTGRTLSGIPATYVSVCWSTELSLFVAVATNGNIIHSSDGINWSGIVADSGYQSVCWSSKLSLFVAVGTGGVHYAITSPDGVNWTPQTLEANSWYGVAWSPSLSLFVAVGSGASHFAASSPDGVNWTTRTLGGVGTQWNSVAWSPSLGLFVAVASTGANRAASSSDGINWTVRTIEANTWFGVCWSPQLGIFVAVSSGATHYSSISSDGVNWTNQTLEANSWRMVCWSPELSIFSAVGTGGTHYASTATIAVTGVSFAWQFSAGNVLVGNQGQGGFFIGSLTGTMTSIALASWAAIDIFAGTAYSQAILTFPVQVSGGLITGIGTVGYTQAGAYSASPTYYGPTAPASIAVGAHAEGPGYAEATFTRSDSGTNIYYYVAPVMGHQTGLWYDYQQSQTQTLCNGYGRLSDFINDTVGNTCALRVVMVPSGTSGGVPAFLSAAAIGQAATLPLDCIGVPLTLNGEFDPSFVVHVVDNGSTRLNVVYRYNGMLLYLSIQNGAAQSINRVSDNVYMINCLSPNNCVDILRGTLTLGANDYNGRILLRSSAAIIATTGMVALLQGFHAYSVDTGVKLITQTFAASTSLIPGIALPTWIDRSIADFGVNVYTNSTTAPVYSISYAAANVTYTNAGLSNVAYVNEGTLQPLAMGYVFYDRVMQTQQETIFLGVSQPPPMPNSPDVLFDYLGYMTGNQIAGQYQAFVLYSQSYLFDGFWIYLNSFNGSAWAGKGLPVACATGLTLVATTPTVAFFLSSFDNSLSEFDGSRNLTKTVRLTAMPTVSGGVYSEHDNSLLLNAGTQWIFVRDGVISSTAYDASQTGTLSLFDTVNGAVIANVSTAWQYTFFTQTGATVVPLAFQTAYFGIDKKTTSQLLEWIFDLYMPTPAAVTVTVTYIQFDVDGTHSNPYTFQIGAADWDGNGFWRGRLIPDKPPGIGHSLEIQVSVYVIVNGVHCDWKEIGPVTPAGARSQ